ncbi:hypothetical protein EHW99_0918 [Erwinia amylovora]|nr:hypothetical protein EHX00_0918 [Erwinia amylovora]QJQ57323.1 hypothetical protein EHW99_0918 [Erwinia amylovora]QJQ61022.1 hypothetical protein EHW98_0918 [Erwinia amylovora]QJQ64824.1 hypothetical protein EHW96_0918 [Erwinia amylovora]QJQ68523.1 hypothetical protein EGZ89_0918 [Erwinia amylovora]
MFNEYINSGKPYANLPGFALLTISLSFPPNRDNLHGPFNQ